MSLLTLLVAIFLSIPLAVLPDSHKNDFGVWCGYLPDHSLNGFVGSLYSFHELGLTSHPQLSIILCYFPDFGKYNYNLERHDPSLEEAGLLLE